jgi:glycosyltransferase involved in cell wall biosynthesis
MAPLRRLLYMCEYPPSTVAGAPVILRQLLSHYDPDCLEVLCCGDHYPTDDPLIRASHLACNHTTIPRMQPWDLRPRRLFVPLWDTLNLVRIRRIVAAGRELVEQRGLEAILTVPWRCDFALAALRLSRETGLPLYVYETDDWEAMNSSLLPGRLVRRNHGPLLQEAERVWLISPAMIERYRERFGVEGDFLFHSVDVDRYRRARPAGRDRRPLSPFSIVYTGSINQMFYGAMKAVAELVKGGLEVAGRPVELNIYGACCPPDLLGPNVIWHGLVDSENIPSVLAGADVLLLGVTFSDSPDLVELVKTCIYTKTVDYLAADRPLLIVAPSYAAEVKHFRDVATVVDSPAPERIAEALRQIAAGGADVRERSRRGLEMVSRHHSSEVVAADFLDAFRKQAA